MLYHTNICTSRLYELAVLHNQTSGIIQVVHTNHLILRLGLTITVSGDMLSSAIGICSEILLFFLEKTRSRILF